MATVFEPAPLGPITLRNRVIKAATFEGASRDGQVGDALVGFHRRVAEGGAGMSTVAYLAVSPDGRTDRHCIVLTPDAVPGLRRVTDAVHGAGAAAAAQIGHAGPVANGASNRAPVLAPSAGRTMSGSKLQAVTEEDIERITEDYRRAAEVAVEAGFDSLEVHLGHNYLLSAFLSPKLNRRTDRFGGDVGGRAAFPRQVVAAVRQGAGRQVAVTAKLNMEDGVKGGLGVDDSLAVARLLQDDDHLDALELTGGSSLANPMYLFRGDAPRKEFAATLPPPLRLGFRLLGRRLMPAYPFEEAYFRPQARRFLAELSLPLVLLGGVTRLDTMEAAVGEGFAFVAMGRALLREPDLVARMRAGTATEATCVHCNKCMPTIYTGTRCVLEPSEPVTA
jgi:2,4-dienoyl-CoA reductase-like NADH-dependent reductase (Old Yellow Enzyme family)